MHLVVNAEVTSPLMNVQADFSVNLHPLYSGKIFNSYDEAKGYYFQYASKCGFSVRKGTTRVVDRLLIVRSFVCYMEGFSCGTALGITNASRKTKLSREMRCGCRAMLRIKRISETERWVVGSVIDRHNHAMVTPSKRWYLRMNKLTPTRSRELFRLLQFSNFPPSKPFQIVAIKSGGYDCMTFSQVDFNNMRVDQSLVSKQDVDLIIERFEEQHLFNPKFYYNLLRDQSG